MRGGWLSRARRNSVNVPTSTGLFSNKEWKRGDKRNEKKNFWFFYRFFEVFLLDPGICLLFIFPLEARQFFFTGSEVEIPPQGGL